MSCPFHGRFRRNCSRMCHSQLQRMTLTEQEAEEEMMLTAVAMSNSVLSEPDELQQQYELQRHYDLQHRNELRRQEELDMELAIALSNFDRLEQSFESPTQPSPQQRQGRQERHRWHIVARQQNNSVSDFFANSRAIHSNPLPSNTLVITANSINLQLLQVELSIGRQASLAMAEFQPDSPYYGLHPMYYNYRYVPVKFSEEHQWPAAAVYNQLEELNIDRGNEDIVEWLEGQSENDRCLICLTNVATRVAVPCGHKLSCRECIGRVITTAKSNKRYLSLVPSGEYVPTRYEIPVRCLLCRCIVGMIVVCH